MIIIKERITYLKRRQDTILDHKSRLLGDLDKAVTNSEQPKIEIIGVKDDFFLFNDPAMFDKGFNFITADQSSPSCPSLGLAQLPVSRLTPPADSGGSA